MVNRAGASPLTWINYCCRPDMKPAQIEALAGTSLLVFSAFRRGPVGLLAFLGATALIVHATVSRAAQGFH
jgi:hypothetical protein